MVISQSPLSEIELLAVLHGEATLEALEVLGAALQPRLQAEVTVDAVAGSCPIGHADLSRAAASTHRSVLARLGVILLAKR